MNVLKNVVAKAPQGVLHAAAILVLGCSAGAGDSSLDDGTQAQSGVTQDLRLHGGLTMRKGPHHPAPPPHHHGHQPPGHAGSPGSAGSAGSSSGQGAGGASAGGDSNGDFPSAGGAPEGGFTSSGGSAGFGGSVEDPCGDGIQIWNSCDDGNTISGDGCSATCDVEPGYACTTPGAPCRLQRCGDGFQDYIFIPGDPSVAPVGAGGDPGAGGSAGAAGAGGFGSYVYEGCDDGNTVSGDGCSARCDVEDGFVCPQPGTLCHEPRCGDGFQDFIPGVGAGGAPGGAFDGAGGSAGAPGLGSFESCDDGNTVSGDGCSSTCDVEPGYLCMEPNTPCRAPRCGDGIVDYFYPGTDTGGGGAAGAAGSSASAGFGGELGAGGSIGAGGGFAAGGSAGFGGVEQCDDGNTASGDGCSATCQVE